MNNLLILALSALWLTCFPLQTLNSQSNATHLSEHLYCGTSEIFRSRIKHDHKFRIGQETYEHNLYQSLQATRVSTRSNNNCILPVVFHVVHENGTENISDAQIEQGLTDLNEAFANMGYYDPSTGVATGIQFCQAIQGPDGMATTGITRTKNPLTEVVMNQTDLDLKRLVRWNPRDYINIYHFYHIPQCLE